MSQLVEAFEQAACLSAYLSLAYGSDGKLYVFYNGSPLGRAIEDYVDMEVQGMFAATYGLNTLIIEILVPLREDAELAFECLRHKIVEIGIPLLENLDDPILKIQWFDILSC